MGRSTLRVLGRNTAGVRLFDVADGEFVVSAVRIDEQADPENEAEAAVAGEMAENRPQETSPYTPPDRDDPTPTEPGGDSDDDE